MNAALSLARARAVRTLLLVDLRRDGDGRCLISISGRGVMSPVASNATVAGRAQNRRVVVLTLG